MGVTGPLRTKTQALEKGFRVDNSNVADFQDNKIEHCRDLAKSIPHQARPNLVSSF